MYGNNRQPLTFRCAVCGAACPVWVDPDDLERFRMGLFVQYAFTTRTGTPYLTDAERELFIGGACNECWKKLHRTNVCGRCGKAVLTAGLCGQCSEVAQLCAETTQFVMHCAPLFQAAADRGRIAVDMAELLRLDFFSVVLRFGLADGALSAPETAILADLLNQLDQSAVTSRGNALQYALTLAENFVRSNPKPIPETPTSLALVDAFDEGTGTQYGAVLRSLLFRLADLVVKADGAATEPELRFLSYYDNLLRCTLTKTPQSEIAQPIRDCSKATPVNTDVAQGTSGKVDRSVSAQAQARSLESLVAELNALIGLKSVKAEVARLIAFLQVEHLKKARGLKAADISLHMEFYGNPGTGKTTVARLLGQIFQSLGFLSSGHLVEADRSRLVGGYLGQTAIKTSETIQQALGGVLFIDEAYSLARTNAVEDTYGQEAIETLLKNMEDHRCDFVVIVAGYPDEMAQFLSSNPGLKSRFNRFINFDDYSPDELFNIFQHMSAVGDYRISTSAAEKLRTILWNVHQNRDRQFGNGRFVRNLFEDCIERLDTRVVNLRHPTNDELMTIEAVDLPEPEKVKSEKRSCIGFERPQAVAGSAQEPAVTD